MMTTTNKADAQVRVLTVISSPNLVGGTPSKTLNILRNSVHKHYIYFYCRGYNPKEFESDFAVFSQYAVTFDGSADADRVFKTVDNLVKIVDENQIQVVQGYFFLGELACSLLKRRRPNLKIVIGFVNPTKGNNFFRRIVENWCLKRIDYAVYITKAVKKLKQSAFPALKKIPSKVIYNGAVFREPGDTFDGKFAGFRLTFIGEFNDWKNQPLLIEAMNILVNEMKINDIHLNFIGIGLFFSQAVESVKKLGLEDKITFSGYSKDIGSALLNTDLYVHPAFKEGFGIAVTEAMLYGLPVLLADAMGLPELIEDGVEGYLLPPHEPRVWADKIAMFYHNRQLLSQMGSASKARAERIFTIANFVNEHDKIYSRLAGETNSNG